MDASQTLAETTRRYLAADISLAELWDVGCTLDHRFGQLPVKHLERRLMVAIVQGMTLMDDGMAPKMICGDSCAKNWLPLRPCSRLE